MENKTNEKVFVSTGCVQRIFKNYYSPYSFLITIEEHYSETGLSKPILIFEEGKISKGRKNEPLFVIKKPIVSKIVKDMELRNRDETFLLRRLGKSKLDAIKTFIYRENQNAKRFNQWKRGTRDHTSTYTEVKEERIEANITNVKVTTLTRK